MAAAALAGALAAAAAVAFGQTLVVWPVWFGPALVGLVLARVPAGGGIPEVRAALATGERVSGRAAVVKTAAAWLTIGAGGSAGAEGPIVYLAAAVGSRVARGVPLRPVMAAAAAGGIAGSFEAPLTGVVLAVEVLLEEATALEIAAVVVGSAAGTVVARVLPGAPVRLPVVGGGIGVLWAGLVAGLAGVVLVRSLGLARRLAEGPLVLGAGGRDGAAEGRRGTAFGWADRLRRLAGHRWPPRGGAGWRRGVAECSRAMLGGVVLGWVRRLRWSAGRRWPPRGGSLGDAGLRRSAESWRAMSGGDHRRRPSRLRPFFGGLLAGPILVALPAVGGVGPHLFEGVTSGATATLLLLAAAKILATSLTFAAGGIGGTLGPTLVVGAAAGSAFGAPVAGMAACLAAAGRAPATALAFGVELTGIGLLPSTLAAVGVGGLVGSLTRDTVFGARASLARR